MRDLVHRPGVEPQGPATTGRHATRERTDRQGTSRESEHTFTQYGNGIASGTQDRYTTTTGRGTHVASSRREATYDGDRHDAVEVETESFRGLEAQLTRLTTCSDQELSTAIEVAARYGLFGEDRRSYSFRRGPLTGSAQAKQSAGVGAQGSLSATATADTSKHVPALSAVLTASCQVGAWYDGEFKARADLGPLSAKAMVRIAGFLGGRGTLTAATNFNLKEGLNGTFTAEGFAGVEAEAHGTAEISLGPAQLVVGGDVSASIGVGGKVAAGVSIGVSGVSATFSASGFAGLQAKAGGSAGIKVGGRKLVWAAGTITANLGVGGSVSGEFTIKSGKLRISGEVAAALGLGGGGGATVEVDAAAIATLVCAKVGALATDEPSVTNASPDFERLPIQDPDQAEAQRQVGYDAVIETFLAYGQRKAVGGDHGVKKEKVQGLINAVAPLMRSDFAHEETDQGIQRAAMEAFRGQLDSIVVQAGIIRAFQTPSSAQIADFKTRSRDDQKWRDAVAPVTTAFQTLVTDAANSSVTRQEMISRTQVEKVVATHHKRITAAFPDADADGLIMHAAEGLRSQFLKEFSVHRGRVTSFQQDIEASQRTQLARARAHLGDLKDQARGQARAAFEKELGTYRGVVMDGKARVTLEGLNSRLGKALALSPTSARGPELDLMLGQAVTTVLAGLVASAQVTEGVVVAFDPLPDGVRDSKGGAALAEFSSAMAAYKDKKTGQGKDGVKQSGVQELLDKHFKKHPDYLASPEGSAAITEAIEAALGTWASMVSVQEGKLEHFQLNHQAITYDKAVRSTFGKARLTGGQEQDNARRQKVADGLRDPLKKYAAKIRAAGEADPRSADAWVTKEALQRIIDDGLRSVRADVANPVGYAAIVTAIRDKLPMVTDLSVDLLLVKDFAVDSGFFLKAAAKEKQSAELRAAVDSMASMLARGSGRKPLMLVQQIADSMLSRLPGVPDDEKDAAVLAALYKVWGPDAAKYKVSKGRVSSQ